MIPLVKGNREQRFVRDYAKLGDLAHSYMALDVRVVVTIGTFDMIHIGHSRYLERAKSMGDILIVGVDSDRMVQHYKGPLRPMIPEDERAEMLLHTSYVDFVTLLDDIDDDGNWAYGLIQAVKPDVFVAVEGSYPEEQLARIREYAKEVEVLPRQAMTSTSEVIRKAMLSQNAPLAVQLRQLAEKVEKGELD